MYQGQFVYDHCLTMIKELEKLGMTMYKKLQVDLILQSLPNLCGQFIVNYHINKIDCTKAKFLNILVIIEGALKVLRGTVLTMELTSSSKRKSNQKKKPIKNQKTKSKLKREVPKKKVVDKEKYFHYNIDSHWKRNCPIYLEFLKMKKDDTPSKGMANLLVIKINLIIFSTSNWIIEWLSFSFMYFRV